MTTDGWFFDPSKYQPGGFARKPVDAPKPATAVAPAVNAHALPTPVGIDLTPPSAPASKPEPAPVGYPESARPVPPMPLPPRFAQLVDAAWRQAVYQFAEGSIASALATMSALCSRSYHFDGLGLNLYVLLLAPTGMGKSFASKAIDNWKDQLTKLYQTIKPNAAGDFAHAKDCIMSLSNMIRGSIGSASGLEQHIAEHPSTLIYQDEFANTIKEMNNPRAPQPEKDKRDLLLRLVEKSGPGNSLPGRMYSKRSANAVPVPDVISPALTVLGTGTHSFYNDLTIADIEGGFIPRFVILDFDGKNMWQTTEDKSLPTDLLMFLRALHQQHVQADKRIKAGDDSAWINVVATTEARARLDEYSLFCWRKQSNAREHEEKQGPLWTRIDTHVKKIASLIAIAENPYVPTMLPEYVDVAIKIVQPAINKLEALFVEGRIGTGDNALIATVREVIAKMAAGRYNYMTSVRPDYIQAGLILLAPVRLKCLVKPVFKEHKAGASRAFEDTIKAMINYSELYVADYTNDNAKIVKAVTMNMEVFLPIIDGLPPP